VHAANAFIVGPHSQIESLLQSRKPVGHKLHLGDLKNLSLAQKLASQQVSLALIVVQKAAFCVLDTEQA